LAAWLNHFWLYGTAITFQALGADFPSPFNTLRAWHPNPITGWSTMLRPLIAPHRWFWNINQMSIAYAFRPRLRPD
jgi:hypothetical protein